MLNGVCKHEHTLPSYNNLPYMQQGFILRHCSDSVQHFYCHCESSHQLTDYRDTVRHTQYDKVSRQNDISTVLCVYEVLPNKMHFYY